MYPAAAQTIPEAEEKPVEAPVEETAEETKEADEGAEKASKEAEETAEGEKETDGQGNGETVASDGMGEKREAAMNILILSVGIRDLIVRYFKENMAEGDCLIAADCSPYAPALYEADKHYLIPRIDEEGYLEKVLEICDKEAVTAVFSLIDPELSILAANEEKFREVGTIPVVSPYELTEMCLHKAQMIKCFEELGMNAVQTFTSKIMFQSARAAGRLSFPVFVKPEDGSASINTNLIYSLEEYDSLFHRYDNLMVQEFMNCREIGADAYVDMFSGKCVSIFTKTKLRMRAGETDKAVSFKDERLFALISEFAEKAGFVGMIDIDIFERDGEYCFSEVNPRFGGGYPHAYACGVNFPKLLINNLRGHENPVQIGNYEEGVVMMKYSDVMIKKDAE